MRSALGCRAVGCPSARALPRARPTAATPPSLPTRVRQSVVVRATAQPLARPDGADGGSSRAPTVASSPQLPPRAAPNGALPTAPSPLAAATVPSSLPSLIPTIPTIPTPTTSTVPLPTASPATDRHPSPTPTYNWFRNWWPVAPVSYFDPARPTPVTLGGRQLVAWRHAAQGWVVQEDRCPHRLAPLSEGRLEAGGTRLACSYHGWEFDGSGKCTHIPQLANDPRAAATACSSRRSCVASFPTLERDGLLFAWMDNSPEGLKAKEEAPLPPVLIPPENSIMDWYMNEFPSDYSYVLEMGMDPTHASYLHHGVGGFRREHAVPMAASRVTDLDPQHLERGFTWSHRGYEVSNKDMVAVRHLHPPFMKQAVYDMPHMRMYLSTISVPVRPGVTRSYGRMGFAPPPAPSSPVTPTPAAPVVNTPNMNNPASVDTPGVAEPKAKPTPKPPAVNGINFGALLSGLVRRLPHWFVDRYLVSDQDILMVAGQEGLMRSQGLTFRSFNLNSAADEGCAATRRWLQLAGYPGSMWHAEQRGRLAAGARGAQQGAAGVGVGADNVGPLRYGGRTYGAWPEVPLTPDVIFNRYDRHVRHCATCQRAFPHVTRVCWALTALAALATVAAATAMTLAALSPAGAAAVGGGWRLAAAVAAAAGLAAAAVGAWEWREVRFVSGLRAWQRRGGLGAPVTHKGGKK